MSMEYGKGKGETIGFLHLVADLSNKRLFQIAKRTEP